MAMSNNHFETANARRQDMSTQMTKGANATQWGASMYRMTEQTDEIKRRQQELLDERVAQRDKNKEEPVEGLPLLVHGVSVGVVGKPVVRTVLVKDLRKAARQLKMPLPTQGIFAGAACGLFALFDGQSCTGEVGPQAAGYCAQQFHLKILPKLAALAPDNCNYNGNVSAALVECFTDLDDELQQRAEGAEGCGACVALVIGQTLFTAIVGKCNAILAETTFKPLLNKDGKREPDGDPRPIVLGDKQGMWQWQSEKLWTGEMGMIFSDVKVQVIRGALNSIAMGSIGDHASKSSDSQKAASDKADAISDHASDKALSSSKPKAPPQQPETQPVKKSTPEVHCINLDWGVGHPYIFMVSAPIADSVGLGMVMDVAAAFSMRPKVMSGEIATTALEFAKSGKSSQCTVCALCFLPPAEVDAEISPGASSVALHRKKQKTGLKTGSMRFRHILVKHRDIKNAKDLRNKDVTRTKVEAEAMLRKALKELRENGEDKVDPSKPEKPTPTFERICKEISECQTAMKGAANRGDLGWMSKDEIKGMGGDFEEIANSSQLATWSDIAYSNEGCHLLLRIA